MAVRPGALARDIAEELERADGVARLDPASPLATEADGESVRGIDVRPGAGAA